MSLGRSKQLQADFVRFISSGTLFKAAVGDVRGAWKRARGEEELLTHASTMY